MNNNTFTITLSAGELFCVAGSMGLANLSLPGDPYQDYAVEAIEADIMRGYHSLQRRGLIQPTNSCQWQVDSLVAVLTNWIAAPDNLLIVDVRHRPGNHNRGSLYLQKEHAVWVTEEAGVYHLTLYRNQSALTTDILNWSGLGQIKPANMPAFLLPKTNSDALLPLVWQDAHEEIVQFLQDARLSSADIQQTIQALKQIECVYILTAWIWQGINARQSETLFLSNQVGLWRGESMADRSVVAMQPVSVDAFLKKFPVEYAAL